VVVQGGGEENDAGNSKGGAMGLGEEEEETRASPAEIGRAVARAAAMERRPKTARSRRWGRDDGERGTNS
jgi:hypothetical protein